MFCFGRVRTPNSQDPLKIQDFRDSIQLFVPHGEIYSAAAAKARRKKSKTK